MTNILIGMHGARQVYGQACTGLDGHKARHTWGYTGIRPVMHGARRA